MGIGVISACTLLFSTEATSELVCTMRAWLIPTTAMGMVAPMTLKTLRITRIFQTRTALSSTRTTMKLAGKYFALILTQLCICIVSWGKHQPTANLALDGYRVTSLAQCPVEGLFVSATMVFHVIILAIGAVTAWKTRQLPQGFNESTHLLAALCLVFVYGAIFVPLSVTLEDEPNALLVIRGIAPVLTVLLVQGALCGPKLILIYHNQQDKTSLIETWNKSVKYDTGHQERVRAKTSQSPQPSAGSSARVAPSRRTMAA